MRILVTGLNGTLGPHLAAAARGLGWEPVGWNRGEVSPDDPAACRRFVEACRPGAIVHLAMGSEAWAGLLAGSAAALGRPFVFASTAMVFDHLPDGPHAPHDERTARDEYGRYKIRCEDAVRAAHPGATVARIGWQIGLEPRGNNMLAHLDEWQRCEGRVRASRAWTPACSFLDDTAAALLALVAQPVAGPVHLDSNALEAHRFDRVAGALQQRFERGAWRIEPHDEYRHDQRLVDPGPPRLPPLSARLPALALSPTP
jgi:dTDP-4-dehydrorhamnose reductase